MTRAQPAAVAGEVEPVEDQGVDGITEEDLGEGVLAVVGVEELIDGLIGETE